MKRTFETTARNQGAAVAWAQRGERAVPAVAVPTLRQLGSLTVLTNQKRLAVLFISRVAFGLALFAISLTNGWMVGLLPATWLIYGGSLTAVHHLIHGSLGLSARSRRLWLTVLAAIVTESGHALQATHLLHHRSDPSAFDPEGYIEYVPWRRMPIEAFRFRYRLMGWGLSHSPQRRRVRAEAGWHVVVHLAALAALPWTLWPAFYLGAMAAASAIFTVLAGKGPQTNYGRSIANPLVQVRTGLFGRLMLFSHDRHLEHHLYPKVPLPRLRHLDAALAPFLTETVEVTLW